MPTLYVSYMLPDTAPVSPLTAFGRAVTRFEASKVVPEVALRNSLGFILSLILGIVFSGPGAGVIAATGALNLAVCDSRDPYVIRGKRMLIGSVLTGIAVTAGSLSGHIDAAAIVLATLWAFATGMLVALGSQASDIGTLSLVTLVVFAARPLPPLQAAQAGLVAMGGGLLQTLLSGGALARAALRS